MQLSWDKAKREDGSYNLPMLALEFLAGKAPEEVKSNVLQYVTYIESVTPITNREIATLAIIQATYRADTLLKEEK